MHAAHPGTQAAPAPVLPERPVLVIDAESAGRHSVGELWSYREVLYFLIWRDVKLRYKQTVFGAGWALVQPAAIALVFTMFFGRMPGMVTEVPYPLFAFTGLVVCTFMANAVTHGSTSVAGSTNANLVTKVYFPRILLPVAAVFAWLLDLGIGLVVLAGVMAYAGVIPGAGVLLAPVFLVLAVMLALAIAFWTSALNVRYRDVRHALPFVVQFWMFASPIIFPAAIAPNWATLLSLNPLTGILEGFRAALYGTPIDWGLTAISAAITGLLLAAGVRLFNAVERSFADLI